MNLLAQTLGQWEAWLVIGESTNEESCPVSSAGMKLPSALILNMNYFLSCPFSMKQPLYHTRH